MYKDSTGNYISEYSVVIPDFNNEIYSVEGFDRSLENPVKLRNGCVVCYCKPEHLKCVDNLGDVK